MRRYVNTARSIAAASIAAVLGTALLASAAQAQSYTETFVTATTLGDTEFDWGRDGISCPQCNFGQGNNRLNWTQRTTNTGTGPILANVYLAHIDPNTGLMPNQAATDELVDTYAAFWNVYGNGPEWAFSSTYGSQLVYSRYAHGTPAPGNIGAAFATMVNGVWTPSFYTGAFTTSGSGASGTKNSNLPEASQCLGDTAAFSLWKNFPSQTGANPQMFTEQVTPSSTPTLTPIANSNGIGERFVPCTPWLLYQGDATLNAHTYQQVFFYDTSQQIPGITQLTFDNTSKNAGFMFQAPDFNNNYIFFTVANHLTINVYQQFGTLANGAPNFQMVNQIASPDPAEPYINSPEPFIHCTPVCVTYIFMTLAKTPDAQNGVQTPIGLAIATLDPNNPVFNIIAPAEATPLIQRLDPEYFITANGPYIYYSRIHVARPTYQNQGFYFIDTQLGPPSGPCVGSSAEGGLLQTPACQQFLANGQQFSSVTSPTAVVKH